MPRVACTMSMIKERPQTKNGRVRRRRSSIQPPRLVFSPTSDLDRPLSPDTEEHVVAETEGVFRSFMYERYQHDMRDLEAIEQTPPLPELTNFTQEPTSNTARIGRQLAMIGDDINERYKSNFDEMVKMLSITEHTAYDSFASVARRLLREGQMNWGRVITLLCFGYRIAMNVLKRGFRSFLQQIIRFMVRFIVSEKIAKWIADQGGWIASLQYVPESVSMRTIAFIFGFAAVSAGVAWWLARR